MPRKTLPLRRLLAGAGLLMLLLAIGGVAALAVAVVRADASLAEHDRELEALQAAARAANARAERMLASGEHDLAVRVSTDLFARALQELVGYEQTTRRGNRFRILAVAPRFTEGWVEATAQARFDWRWGLYDGPIELRYLAFPRLLPDGSVWLHFRVADVRPLAEWPLVRGTFGRRLSPFLTLRMQRTMRLPDLHLPLGLEPRPPRPEPQERSERRVRIRLASGRWSLGARDAVVYATPHEIGLVAAGLGAAPVAPPADESAWRRALRRLRTLGPEGPGPARPTPAATRALAPPGTEPTVLPTGVDLEIGIRMDRLAALLQRLIEAADDLQVEVAELPLPFGGKGTIAGVNFDRELALRRLRGTLDLRSSHLVLRPDGLDLDVALAGRFVAAVEGTLYGVGFSVPVRLLPSLKERLELRFVNARGEIGLFPEPRPLVVRLVVESRVRGMPLRVDRPLTLPAETVLAPLSLRQFLAGEIQVPTRVERGRIVARRPLPARVAWELVLPETANGHLRVDGRVLLGSAAQRAVAAELGGAAASP